MGRSSKLPAAMLMVVGCAIAGLLCVGPQVPQQPHAIPPDTSAGDSAWDGVLGVPALPVITDQTVPAPLHVRSPFPPGTVIPVAELPPVDNGIPLPDGGFLPFLNGMTYSPSFARNPRFGPVPPVVAKLVDAEGFEWWMHADGSVTTSIYRPAANPGETAWDSTTRHAVATPVEELEPAEPGADEPSNPDLESPDLSEVERQLLELAGQVTNRGR